MIYSTARTHQHASVTWRHHWASHWFPSLSVIIQLFATIKQIQI